MNRQLLRSGVFRDFNRPDQPVGSITVMWQGGRRVRRDFPRNDSRS
jgi:hypothetical protein